MLKRNGLYILEDKDVKLNQEFLKMTIVIYLLAMTPFAS